MDLEELRLQRFAEEVMAEEYNIAVSKDAKIAKLQKAAVDGVAKYRAAEEIASRTGMHTAEVLLSNLTELYPDGKIPEVDAKALITPMLRHNYDYVSGYTKEAQETMNNDIGVNLNAVVPEFDKGRADGIATSISNADDFTQREDSFRLNVENHSRNIVDEAQKQNMRMHDRVGLEAEVVREYDGVGLHDGKDTCEWCESRAGVWGYRDAIANGVFERHPGCGCEITYTSRKGVTTVQSKAGGYWERKQERHSKTRIQINNANNNLKPRERIAVAEASQSPGDAVKPQNMIGDYYDYKEIDIDNSAKESMKELRALADETGWEHGRSRCDGVWLEIHTDKDHNNVKVPYLKDANNIELFHCHTDESPPSAEDMRAFINPAVQRIGVSSANGDGWIIEIGSGIRPSKEEMDVVLNSCYHQAIQNMQDDPYFYGWSFEERSYMLAREQMRLVTNYFEWDVMGGEMA